MRRQLVPLLALTLVLGTVSPRVSQAQWQANGVPVCTAGDFQDGPVIVPDGAGGAIITWNDKRSGAYHIYAQRVNAAGAPQWTTGGVALCTAANAQAGPTIVSDGVGGAIVIWIDYRGTVSGIYAQRVNAAGAPQWAGDGVKLATAAGVVPNLTSVSDGAGGAIVTWAGTGGTTAMDIYAQRVNAAGAPLWTVDGVALCTAAEDQGGPTIASDGAGGAIVTWGDNRNSLTSFNDIYAQRVSAAGAPQWTADGVALCTAADQQGAPTITSDGVGGAIATWEDNRDGTSHIYGQRVNAAGAPQWAADGVALCTASNSQLSPTIVSDGAGGAIVTWEDYRSGTNLDIYTQRVNAAGGPQWTANGVVLCTAAMDQDSPAITSDGAGGAIVTWEDWRSGTSLDVYTQRVNAAGVPQWTANGVALCTAANYQEIPMIATDGAGGAIVTWLDYRNGTNPDIYDPSGTNPDIYAQRVYGSGGVAAVPPQGDLAHFQSLALSPNPMRDGQLTIRFSLPSSARVSAEVLDLAGHRVRTLAADRESSPGPQVLGWDGKNDAGVGVPSGVYFVEVRAGTLSEGRRAVLIH